MEVDPAASVQVWAIEFDLGGSTFTVPPLPAAGWLPVLLDGNPLLVLDLLDSTPVDDDVDSLILTGQVTPDDLVEALTVTIEQAAGRDFHAAFVLAQVARTEWAVISGVLAEKGFRWDEAPLGAALDAIYAIVVKHLNEESLARFHHLLDNPVAVGGRRRVNKAKAMEQFEAMAGPKPEGVPASAARSGSARSRTRTRPRPRPQGAR